MCGRYASFTPADRLHRLFHTVNPTPNLQPTWNMAPTRDAPVYRTRFPGHKTRLSGLLHDGLVPCGPCVAGALETILLEQPGGVVSGDKVAHGGANLIDGLIDAAMDDLLLEGAEEPLRDTIGFGFTDERVAWAHAPEADLVLEVPGHEGAAMVVAQRDAAGSGGAEMAEDGLDRHADGLGRGVAIAAFADVPAGCLGVPVLDHAEQPDLAVLDGGDLGGEGLSASPAGERHQGVAALGHGGLPGGVAAVLWRGEGSPLRGDRLRDRRRRDRGVPCGGAGNGGDRVEATDPDGGRPAAADRSGMGGGLLRSELGRTQPQAGGLPVPGD